MKHERMTHPAPSRVLYPSPVDAGKWWSRKWSLQEVLEYRAIGGHFLAGEHDFEKGVAVYATMPIEQVQARLRNAAQLTGD